MKKLLLIIGLLQTVIYGQTLFFENFNGATHSFTLNTTDLWATSSGYNHWVVNNTYTGGNYFDNVCSSGSITIGNTPNQPININGYPNSNYLHIVSVDAENQGVSNANYQDPDADVSCFGNQAYFVQMNTDISTAGLTNICVSFYWICAGVSNYQKCDLLCSTDGGSNWTFLGPSYLDGASNWTFYNEFQSYLDNQPSVRLGFMFENNSDDGLPHNPGIALDDIRIFKYNPVTITTGSCVPNSVCSGDSVDVHFAKTGTFDAGNVFTAMLSNQFGSFAVPNPIGSLTGIGSGVIHAVIPMGTTPGTNYKIRVVASNPYQIGSSSINETILSCNAGINNNVELSINVFPNPANDQVTVSVPEYVVSESKIIITDQIGKEVYSSPIYQSEMLLNIHELGLKAGIYLVQLQYNHMNKIVRLVVQ